MWPSQEPPLPVQLSWYVMLEEFHADVSTERSVFICKGQAVFTTLFHTWSLRSDNNTLSTQATRFTNSELKTTFWPIPVAARHKSLCGSSLAATEGSNPAGDMAGCRLRVVKQRSLHGRIPHSEVSYPLCGCHQVWRDATLIRYTYSEYVENVRLRKRKKETKKGSPASWKHNSLVWWQNMSSKLTYSMEHSPSWEANWFCS